MDRLDTIEALVESKVLSRELCPTPGFWHWSVLEPDQLPSELKDQFRQYGEIRWYGYPDL